jgi:hypothetical protein
MKVLGARPGQLAPIYLGFALALGLAATLPAVSVAYLLARPYATMRAEMLNFPAELLLLPGWAIALELVLGLLLPVLAAAPSVARACRMGVGAALREVGITSATAGSGSRAASRSVAPTGRCCSRSTMRSASAGAWC